MSVGLEQMRTGYSKIEGGDRSRCPNISSQEHGNVKLTYFATDSAHKDGGSPQYGKVVSKTCFPV
jgi:hypothetical protein